MWKAVLRKSITLTGRDNIVPCASDCSRTLNKTCLLWAMVKEGWTACWLTCFSSGALVPGFYGISNPVTYIFSALVNYLGKAWPYLLPPHPYPTQTLEGWIFGDWAVPSPAAMTCFWGDTAIMWPPFTVTYWGSGDWLAAPVVGTWDASPGSCLMITLQQTW